MDSLLNKVLELHSRGVEVTFIPDGPKKENLTIKGVNTKTGKGCWRRLTKEFLKQTYPTIIQVEIVGLIDSIGKELS